MPHRRSLTSVPIILLVLSAPAIADEAVRTDGRRVRGTLRLTDRGRLRFEPADAGKPLPLSEVSRIRFADASPNPLRVGLGMRVRLRDGQQLSGGLVSLDAARLTLRTAWSERVVLPRAAVAEVSHLPGWRPVIVEAFRDGLAGWMAHGAPGFARADDPASRSRVVSLTAPGQSFARTLAAPLSAGRFGINFRVQLPKEREDLPRWVLQADFAEGKDKRRMEVTVAGPENSYEVKVTGIEGTAPRVARTPGWHRLEVAFTPTTLRVTCDDNVLWYDLKRGAGRLRGLRIACVEPGSAVPKDAGVEWSTYVLERATEEISSLLPAHSPCADQDEVRLSGGDQLYGSIVEADRQGLTMRGRFGRRTFAWTQLDGFSLRWGERPPERLSGAHVRLWLRPGLGTEPDLLDGVVTALDARRLTLRNALLGTLVFERSQVASLRPLFQGERIAFAPGRVSGASWQGEVRLEQTPARARLVLGVQGRLAAGIEVIVNGRRLDNLNRYLEGGGREGERRDSRSSIPLPPSLLRRGDNRLEMRTPAAKAGRHAPCYTQVVLEFEEEE